jgi:hypothetical protein
VLLGLHKGIQNRACGRNEMTGKTPEVVAAKVPLLPEDGRGITGIRPDRPRKTETTVLAFRLARMALCSTLPGVGRDDVFTGSLSRGGETVHIAQGNLSGLAQATSIDQRRPFAEGRARDVVAHCRREIRGLRE